MMKLHVSSGAIFVMMLAMAPLSYAEDVPGAGKESTEKMPQHRYEFLSKLPAEKAQLFKESMAQVQEKNKPLKEQISKLREDMQAILTAANFNKEAYLAKNAEIDKLYDQGRANRNAAFVTAAEKMTQEERKVLAQMQREPRRNANNKLEKAPAAK